MVAAAAERPEVTIAELVALLASVPRESLVYIYGTDEDREVKGVELVRGWNGNDEEQAVRLTTYEIDGVRIEDRRDRFRW
jgi:hypothetical protein